ncbi:MAG: AAA-associated domain-containing protein [Pyrobaculum sp.]
MGVDQILGLLKVIHALGGRVDVMHINEAIDVDLRELSHVIDVAEALGFVRHSGGDVELTEGGGGL